VTAVPRSDLRFPTSSLLTLLLLTGCAAGVHRSVMPAGAVPGEGIVLDVRAPLFRDAGDQGWVVHVHVAFPRSRLLFLREETSEGARWQAEFEWRVVLKTARGGQVGGGVYARSVVLGEGERPEDPGARVNVFQAVTIPSGRYWVEVSVVDRNSVRRGGRSVEIEAFAYRAGEPGLSDLEMVRVPGGSSPAGPEEHAEEVLVSGRTDEDAEAVGWHCEVYAMPPGARLISRLIDEAGTAVRSQERAAPTGPRVTVRDTLVVAGLREGTYRLQVAAHDVGARPLIREAVLIVQRPLLADGTDREAALAQAALFASPEVVERLKGLEEDGRRLLLDSLWAALDPTPETDRNEVREEFVRRLRQVEERWSLPGRHGWRTDIGRVYVTYGEPDEIPEERSLRPATSPLDDPREIRSQTWIYRNPPALFRFEFDRDRGWRLLPDSGIPPGEH
jgi:GWxTD domain-containing protein